MAPRRRGMKAKKSRRPRVARRRYQRKRVSSTKYLRIKETYDAGSFTSNNGHALGVSINNLPQITCYQSLYSKYKITGAKYTFIPNTGNSEVNQVLSNIATAYPYAGLCRVAYSISKGFMSAPANEGAIIAQEHKLRMMGNKGFSVYVKMPVFLVDANPGGVTTESKITTGLLGLNQSADVVHQGLEWYATNQGTANISYKVYITLYATLYESI